MKNLVAILLMAIMTAGLGMPTHAAGDDENNEENTTMTTSFTGKVVDQVTGEMLTGVKVEIKGTDKEVYTDFEGNFSFSSLKPGNYEIVASYISYKDQVYNNVKLELSDNNKVTLKLEPIEE